MQGSSAIAFNNCTKRRRHFFIIDNNAKSGSEQANAVAQIKGGLNQISGVVQSNSATSLEAAAASEEANSQEIMLGKLVRLLEYSCSKRC